MKRFFVRVASLTLVCAGFAACSDEQLNPVPAEPGEGGSTPVPTTPPTEQPPPAPPVRTVIERNPFGNVAAADNLLWDGDFEWASPFSDQYGWWQLPSSLSLEEVAVGPTCRSGLKCARVGRNDEILGVAVGARDEALFASVHVKFEPDEDGVTPGCSDALVAILDIGAFPPSDPDAELVLLTPVPDVTGYCTFMAEVPARANKPFFYIANNSTSSMLVDDAVLVRASSPAALKTKSSTAPQALPLRSTAHSRVTAAKQAARALLPSDDGATPSQRAFEAEARKRFGAKAGQNQ